MTKEKTSPEPRPDFVVFSAPLAVKDDNGGDRPTLVATASSTAIDLEADRFAKSALEQMRDGFKGRVIFMNHSYRVPVDVFGVVEETSLIKREGRLDLDMVIRVETGNPLAVQTYDYVVNGTRLGVSVGVIVTESEKSDDEDEYGTRIVDITGVIPLEASIVGIPANQTAWTQAAIKSLYERGAIEFDDAEVAARPWLNDDDSQEENDMAKDEKHIDENERPPKAEAPADETPDEEPEEKDNSDEKKDQEGEDEEGGGDDAHDANDGDGPHKQDDATPDNDDEPEPETKDDPDEKPDETPDESPESAPVESPESVPDDTKPDGETKDDPETKNDFDDDVAADEAAYALIDKMYTGFYVALDNLIPIILDTDMGTDARRKAGDEVVESWSKYIADTWDEVIEMLDESKAVEMDEDFSLASRLHDLVSANEAVECEATQVQEIVDQATTISDLATKHAEENERLRKELERKAQGLELATQIIDAVMELPIPSVTTQAAQVTQSLAEKFPNLDNKVVELLARHAPPAPGQ